MSIFTRSITFNETTATISFPTKLDSSSQLNWTMSVSSGTNKASTTGNVTIEPYTKPASTGPVTSWPSSITSYPDENKAKQVAFIKEALNTVDTASGRDAKAACSKMLYDYLLTWGMDFIKAHERFKLAVITKAYQLKSQAPENASMIASMDKVLTALNQPLEKPAATVDTFLPVSPPGLTRQVACGGSLTYCGCPGCPDLTYKPVEKPVVSSTEDDNDEYKLFLATANRLGYNRVNEFPKSYFMVYQSLVKSGSITGSPAERIEYYFTQCVGSSDGHQRVTLMKQLFEKNKMTFSPDVMALYNEWQKTYKYSCGTNRYKKMMCAFIEANKNLFTTA